MLHLFPLRFIGRFALAVTALAALALIFLEAPPQGTTFARMMTVVRWMLAVEAALAILAFYFWHYIPGATARWIFPHIDGSWDGHLYYKRKAPFDDGSEQKFSLESKPAQLYVHQSPIRLRIILETDESTSETLLVNPERDPNFSRFRLFYIFENRSRDGLPNNARCYRGTAVMEVQPGRPTVLTGTYFTDQGSEGTFRFGRRPPAHKTWGRTVWHAMTGVKGAPLLIIPEPRDERALELDDPKANGAVNHPSADRHVTDQGSGATEGGDAPAGIVKP